MFDHATAFAEDIRRIRAIAKKAKLKLSAKAACLLWEQVSEDYAAGWLTLFKSDSEIIAAIKAYYKRGIINCPRCSQRIK